MADISKIAARAKQMSDAVKQYVARALSPINSRLSTVETRTGALSMIAARGQTAEHLAAFEALEMRIRTLEARPAMSYQGTWRADTENLPGDVVTDGGSMWYCWTKTKDRPGTSDAWQLCVKRGRDAR